MGGKKGMIWTFVPAFYRKYRNFIENVLFAVTLLCYPLIKINQGLDVVDTSYSLANFQYFPSAKGTWMVATYLANAVGYLLMRFPKGDSLAGIYFYTGLIVSFTALAFYFILRKKMPAWIVFIGEMLAIGLCWCPTTILYNYLTYLLMGAGIALLYRGIWEMQEKKHILFLGLAGVCLGANVAVRMPNVVQAVFILALWYGAWLKRETFRQTAKDTLVCLGGYLAGFGIPFLTICIKYGTGAYAEMIRTMFAMTDQAADYKPASMLTAMFSDYLTGLIWLGFAGACIGIFYIVYGMKTRFLPLKAEWLYRLFCIAVCGVLIRFYWGRGMFNFQYYYYGSIYQWAVLFLLLTIFCAVYVLFGKMHDRRLKVFALLILLQIFVTPLGGNNALQPMFNNLFLAAPFTLWVCFGWFEKTKGKPAHFPWKCMLVVMGMMVLAQSVGFHIQFVFLDGVWGEKRDTLLTGYPKVEGIYTNRENAESFMGLADYAQKERFAGRKVILYGEVPGLSYFFDMPTAISSAWPDLDSYRLVEFERDMETVRQNMEQERPVVITASSVAAYRGEDAEAYKWFHVDQEAYDADKKLQILMEFLDTYGYEETFCNMRYAVYQ